MPSSEPNKSANRQQASIFMRLPILGALVIVFAANLALKALNPLQKVDPESLPVGHGWAWWATNEYLEKEKSFNTVVFGSSAIMHPLWLGEATYRNADVDLVVDHESRCLEDAITKNAPGTNPKCFNFAMPGVMPSDDYMIIKALFKSNKKPNMVVITLHPRDLMDNTFGSAASSRHYKYLQRFVNTQPLLDLAMPEWWRRTVYQLEQTLFLKSKNHDIQLLASENIRSLINPILVQLPKCRLDAKANEDRKLAIYVDELQKGVWIAHPTAPYRFLDAMDDCYRRFKKPNNAQFENQKTWLKMCLAECREQGIAVLLVSTPVTPPVKQLMPPGTYERHMSTIKELACEFNVPYLDANKETQCQMTDFTDWIHMNGEGGQKVLRCIGEFIAKDKQLKASLPVVKDQQLAVKQEHRM